MVLDVPPSIGMLGPVPDIDRATRREAGHRGGMARAHGPTVIEVVPSHIATHLEPVFQILTGVASRKGHRGAGQNRTGRRGNHRGREAARRGSRPTRCSRLASRCR